MKKNNTTQIWLQQQLKEMLLDWRDYFIMFRDNFLLIPSAMLIFGYLLGFINELNRETIGYYFVTLGFLSLFMNTVSKVYFPTYPFPYISKGIEDIRDKKDSKVSYIYFLKLRYGNYTIKEKDDYIDILKDDLTYSVFTKKENENNSFYDYPANQEYIFNLIPSCLPNEKFKFFILTDLIRLIPIIISEESIKVKNQLEKQIPDETQLAYLINKYFVRTLEYQRYVLQDSYLNNLVKQDLAVLFDVDNLDERKRFDLIRQYILSSDNFYFIEINGIVDIEAFNKYIKV